MCNTLGTKYKHLSSFDLSVLHNRQELVDNIQRTRFRNSFALGTRICQASLQQANSCGVPLSIYVLTRTRVSNVTGQCNFSGQRDRQKCFVPGQRDNGTEVPSLPRDKGTTGQAQNLAKGRVGPGQPKFGTGRAGIAKNRDGTRDKTGQSRKGRSKTRK